MDGRPARGADRAARRGAGERARARLRVRVSARLPGGLSRAAGRLRHRAHRAARPGRRPEPEPVPAARLAGRRPRVQAPALGPAAPALRRAPAAREHGCHRHQRAPLRDPPARLPAGLDLRLRAAPRRGREPRARRRARVVPGRLRACLARRDRERRLQQARALGRALGPRDRGAARRREVPAADRDAVQPRVHGGDARRPSRDRRQARRAVPAATRPCARRARPERARPHDRQIDRCGREPRRGPDPAQLPQGDPRRPAHELVPDRCRGEPQAVPVAEARLEARSRAARAAPAGRGVRLLAARRGDPSPWRPRRPRRHQVVGPPRGLPHRGARADEGADGEERRDRAGGREGRLRRAAATCRPRAAAGGGRRLLPHVHARPARHHRHDRRR